MKTNNASRHIKIGIIGLIVTVISFPPVVSGLVMGPIGSYAQNIDPRLGGGNDPLSFLGDPLETMMMRFTLIYTTYGVLFLFFLTLLIAGFVQRHKAKSIAKSG